MHLVLKLHNVPFFIVNTGGGGVHLPLRVVPPSHHSEPLAFLNYMLLFLKDIFFRMDVGNQKSPSKASSQVSVQKNLIFFIWGVGVLCMGSR